MAGKLSITAKLDIGGNLYFYFFPPIDRIFFGIDGIGSRMKQIKSAPIKMACGEVRADLDKLARGMSGEETSLHEPLSEIMIQVWKVRFLDLYQLL